MVLIAHNYSIHGVYKPTFTSPVGPTKRSEKDLRTVEKRWIFASFAMAQQHAWNHSPLGTITARFVGPPSDVNVGL